MTNQQLRCPRCDQIEKIQKVTSIFLGGIATGTYAGSSVGVGVPIGEGQTTITSSHTTLSGSSQSLLSKRLSPPPKPTAKGRSCWVAGAAIVLLWSGIAPLLFVLGSIVSGQVEPLAVIINSVWGIGFTWAGVAVWRSSSNAARKRREEAAAQLPSWEKAVGHWNKLYYCARDDGVFDPDEGVFVPTEQMIEYIYR